MLSVDKDKIKRLMNSSFTDEEIAEKANISAETVKNVRYSQEDLENASYSVLVDLTEAYDIFNGEDRRKDLSIQEKQSNVDAAVGINAIDGIVIRDEDLEDFNRYATGDITTKELEEKLDSSK